MEIHAMRQILSIVVSAYFRL